MVQHIEIRDATGSLRPTPGTPVSAILVPWNPDDSWRRDALLRATAVLGAPTRTHTVYEHVDVMVHPLGVNLVESIAQSFWVKPLHHGSNRCPMAQTARLCLRRTENLRTCLVPPLILRCFSVEAPELVQDPVFTNQAVLPVAVSQPGTSCPGVLLS